MPLALKKSVHINGFRTFLSIPINIARLHVQSDFKRSDDVAQAIVCLWAEKNAAIIEILQNAAIEENIPVHKN